MSRPCFKIHNCNRILGENLFELPPSHQTKQNLVEVREHMSLNLANLYVFPTAAKPFYNIVTRNKNSNNKYYQDSNNNVRQESVN